MLKAPRIKSWWSALLVPSSHFDMPSSHFDMTCDENDLTQWHAQVGVFCRWQVPAVVTGVSTHKDMCMRHLCLMHMSSCPHTLLSSLSHSCPHVLTPCSHPHVLTPCSHPYGCGLGGWRICLATPGRRIWVWTLDAYVYALLTHVLIHSWRMCLSTPCFEAVPPDSVFWGCACSDLERLSPPHLFSSTFVPVSMCVRVPMWVYACVCACVMCVCVYVRVETAFGRRGGRFERDTGDHRHCQVVSRRHCSSPVGKSSSSCLHQPLRKGTCSLSG